MITRRRLLRFVAATLAVASAAQLAAGGTVTVKKGGAISTIQAGIDLAGPGDTVRVHAGLYRENVVIPNDVPGLELRGVGKVVLDARPAGGLGAGPGITSMPHGVRIRGFIIENAENEAGVVLLGGYGVRAQGDDVVVEQCEIRSCKFAVFINGKRAVVKNCDVSDCVTGITITESDAAIIGTKFERLVSDAARIISDRGVIMGCSAKRCGGGFIANGDQSTIEKNLIEMCFFGLSANGAGGKVRANKVIGVATNGLFAAGSSVDVVDNVLEDCGFAQVAQSGVGIFVSSQGGRVAGNVVRGAGVRGIEIWEDSLSLTIEDNVVTRSALLSDAGIWVRGASHVLLHNVVKDNAGDGIRIECDGCQLTGNKASSNGRDGFDIVSGLGTVLTGNVAIGNRAEGFDNAGTDTSFLDNKASKNRVDFASTKPIANFFGNQSADGSGPATLPEID